MGDMGEEGCDDRETALEDKLLGEVLRSSDATTTVDASAGSDVLGIVTLEFFCVLLNTHGANLVHNPVELFKSSILGTSNADDLALAERLVADCKRADIAAEETRNKDGSNKTGNSKDDLDPADDATSQENLRVPHDHPWDVGKEGGGRREDGEWRIRGLPVRIVISNTVHCSKLSRGITLRSNVKRPEKRNTKDCILNILKLPGGCTTETDALDGNDGHDILKKTHWASPGAKSTTSNKTSTKNHSDGKEGEDSVSESNLKRFVSTMNNGERRTRRLEIRYESFRRSNTKEARVYKHQNCYLNQETGDINSLNHSSYC